MEIPGSSSVCRGPGGVQVVLSLGLKLLLLSSTRPGANKLNPIRDLRSNR